MTAAVDLPVVLVSLQLLATIGLGVGLAVLGSRLEHRRWLREQRAGVYSRLVDVVRDDAWLHSTWQTAKLALDPADVRQKTEVGLAEAAWLAGLPAVSSAMASIALLGSRNAQNRALDWRREIEREREGKSDWRAVFEASTAFLEAAKCDLQHPEPLLRRSSNAAPPNVTSDEELMEELFGKELIEDLLANRPSTGLEEH